MWLMEVTVKYNYSEIQLDVFLLWLIGLTLSVFYASVSQICHSLIQVTGESQIMILVPWEPYQDACAPGLHAEKSLFFLTIIKLEN